MTKSNPYTLVDNIYGAGTFQTTFGENDYSTVIKVPIIPFGQGELENAVQSGHVNDDGSINYVNFYSKGEYEQLGAPDQWMGSLVNDPIYWNTINESIGGENPNVGIDETVQFNGGVLIQNEDPNALPTTTNTPSGILRYPANNTGGYDYLLISTYKRTPSTSLFGQTGFDLGDVDDVASTKVDAPDIALPMQPGISDSNSVDWGSDTLNPIQLALGRVAYGAMGPLSELNLQGAGENVLNALKGATAGLLGDITETDIKAYFAGQAVGANIFTRATGKVINPNLELLFRGPLLRTFNYNYTFTPRDSDEARVIRSIIKHFKKNMAVQRSNSGLFLETPNIFKLTYVYAGGNQHPFLNKIKKCALTNFNVEYTPDGSYMTYKDGSMTSYGVTMQFSELTPIYSNNYDNSDDMGY
jgi:hypothetical protein